ncbi:hypothetical protein QR680_003445 [Steinernema hermaphroditum]|uniref:E1 ubiquitin-activating enzyme n=1 Tax=Steinernema hermaphroditum TaxID=289476 RepID=A0AA39H8X9_9BILA|nr:hypothetical protein QR680_003445 [Steinernema hermaphroditum]
MTTNSTPKSSNSSHQSHDSKRDQDGGGDMLDKNLYSRQIYALGESAMMHLRKSAVLISGLGGVGVEIAKNLVLGGVRHVTIHDTKETSWYDLSSQYYLDENDIGRNRAQSCLCRLSELNDSVQVSASTEQLSEEMISHFDLVILTDADIKQQDIVNVWTRNKGRYLLVADARGLFSYIALDAGKDFQIDDKNGEQCHEFLIDYIDKDTGDVTTLDNVPHNLEDGDYVSFAELKGMTELNNCPPLRVTVTKPDVFNVGNALKTFTNHIGGGRGKQVKVPVKVNYVDLQSGREDPSLVIWDYGKIEYGICLHYLWQALYTFEEKHKRTPLPRNENDFSLFFEELIDAEEVEYPEYLVRNFCFQAKGNLVTTCSVVGGIASQEAMKLITHHMTPLKQFMYIDHLDALPAPGTGYDAEYLTEEDCGPRDSRYDGQVAVFGWNYQEEIMRQKWFIVGAGAIGCELLKNFSMMGVACDPSRLGVIKITDMDQIEISNLNRQFLFRRHDVGKKKSDCAARAARCFNPDLNIIALSERVSSETEQIFDDYFFGELNGVANALDNIDARRYVDRRCVYYRLPLLESGTQGTKGNTQVIYPYLTESYGSSSDPPETEIPMCTLKNFPHQIHHTIQWARDRFEGLFTNPVEIANSFLSDQRGFHDRLKTVAIGQQVEMLTEVTKALIDDRPNNAEDCIKWARLLFEEYYHNTIAQLLFTFPADQITSQGVKFWSGAKRCPHFAYSASLLHAEKYGIEPVIDKKEVMKVLHTITLPVFKPATGVKIAVTEAEAKDAAENVGDDADQVLDGLLIKLAKMPIASFKPLKQIDFEKDDDTNHHMEFVTAASNLRAENYDIEPADTMKTKQIAGRIIPALATTTATVAGLISVELYKMIDIDGKLPTVPISRFRNGFINLALPFFGMSEPVGAPEKAYNDVKFTLWDRLDVGGNMTLRGFIKWIEDKSRMKISMLSSGVSLIYAYFMPAAKIEARLNMSLREVVELVTKKPIPSHTRGLVFEATMDGEFDSVEIPYIRYALPLVAFFTLHQDGIQRHCVDLQCPRSAFEGGKHSLLIDENGATEECKTSLQTPPKPVSTGSGEYINVDVEAFWQEPYWREFDLSNLTLHYEFVTESPERCDGTIRTIDGATSEHHCHGVIALDMTNDDSLSDEPADAQMFDYDDRPQIEFERDVFYDAKSVKFWVTVNVTRPRQLQFNSGESPFVDVITELPSDEMQVGLTHIVHESLNENVNDAVDDEIAKMPIVSKTQDIKDVLVAMDKSTETTTTTTELDDDDEGNNEDDDSSANEEPASNNDRPHDEQDDSEENNNVIANADEEHEENGETITDSTDADQLAKQNEKNFDINDEDVSSNIDLVKEDGEGSEEFDHLEKNSTLSDDSHDQSVTVETTTEVVVEEQKSESENVIVDEIITGIGEDDYSSNITTTATNIFDHYIYSPEKELARMVFFVTIGATLVIVILAFIFKKGWCCGKSKQDGNVTTKTSNGYKYHVAKTQDMVGNKERELLNQ